MSNFQSHSEANGHGHGKTILVVDDDQLICKLAKDILENFDYPVAAFLHGRDAVNYYEQHPNDVALAIVDLAMPEMDGEKVIERLHKVNSELRIILSSGCTNDFALESLQGKGISAVMSKPYGVGKLLEMVKSVLG